MISENKNKMKIVNLRKRTQDSKRHSKWISLPTGMSGTQTPTNMVTTLNHSIAQFPSESGTIEITVTSRIESGFISFVGCMREIFTLVDKLHFTRLSYFIIATLLLKPYYLTALQKLTSVLTKKSFKRKSSLKTEITIKSLQKRNYFRNKNWLGPKATEQLSLKELR